MHKLRQLATNTKQLFSSLAGDVGKFYKKNRDLLGSLVNILTILAFVTGIIALFTLIWLYVRPIQLADIKVPVATDQASYYPGEEISGIFFGEIKYKGEVQVLREVFCKSYKNIIAPPESARNGDFYDTQSIPRKIEGLTVTIGNLPADIPVGLNCVLQFTNVYRIQTPFGIRQEVYQYYTQNFAIVTKERRAQLECEAAGRKDCVIGDANQQPLNSDDHTIQSSPDSPEPSEASTPATPQTNTNTAPRAQERPAPPAPQRVQRCTVNLLGIKIGCRNVVVE